jgi:hypothetical protein
MRFDGFARELLPLTAGGLRLRGCFLSSRTTNARPVSVALLALPQAKINSGLGKAIEPLRAFEQPGTTPPGCLDDCEFRLEAAPTIKYEQPALSES